MRSAARSLSPLLACLFFACHSTGAPSEGPVTAAINNGSESEVEALAGAEAIDPASDDDQDRVRYECDRCPDDPETYNGILDADGCPDSSGQSHAVIEDPTNRYGFPVVVVDFADGQTTVPPNAGQRILSGALSSGALDLRDAESIVCVGQASHEPNPDALGVARARATCELMRQLGLAPGAQWTELSVGAGEVTSEPHPPAPSPSGALVVTRAAGVDVWRLDGRVFVRATPPARLEYAPPLTPECEPE